MPTGEYEDVMTGFVPDDRRASGRPVGVTVARDGSLLVADDPDGGSGGSRTPAPEGGSGAGAATYNRRRSIAPSATPPPVPPT